jgi:hypothetical protein
LGGLLALLGVLTWMVWRRKEPAFWALGFFVLLAPSSSLVPAYDVMFEHRTYFPLVCLVMAAAWLLVRLPRPARGPVVATLLLALLAGTIARNRVWRDDKLLLADVIRKSPHKPRAYIELGWAYAQEDPQRSRELFERVLELDPNNTRAHNDLGLVMMMQNHPRDALPHFLQAMTLGGETPAAWNNIGAARLRLGETDEAERSFRRALELDTCYFEARWDLMEILASTGRKEEAIRAGLAPAGCRPSPGQAEKLEELRRALR